MIDWKGVASSDLGLQSRARARVAEGPQHPGHVPEGQPLEAALVKGASRFAFEIDDHEVMSRVQDLAEVVVAVDADPRRALAPAQELLEKARDARLELEHLLGFFPSVLWQPGQLGAKEVGRAHRQPAHRLIN